MMGKISLYFVILSFSTLQSIFAILCYDCVEADQDQCQSGRGLQYTECFEPIMYDKRMNGSRAACIKTVSKVDDIERTFRSCGVWDGPEDSCKKIENHMSGAACYTCDTDYCNGSNNIEIKFVLSAIFSLWIITKILRA